ncbi:MAG: hypothetical protein ABWZ66_11320 [Pyrinomonadaceae bacterium]
MKILLLLIITFSFSISIYAQSKPVQINGGKIFVSRTSAYNEQTQLISSSFTSVGTMVHVPSSHWAVLCSAPSCQPGTTFNSVGGSLSFDIRDVHPRGNFTINGTTHENVFYSGYFELDQHTFLIPRTSRKKGLMLFQAPFKLNGRLLVCKIDDFAAGCPADKTIYDGPINGHGTMVIRMRVKFTEVFGQMRTYLQTENFEYRFEP